MTKAEKILDEARYRCLKNGGNDGWVVHSRYAAKFAKAVARKVGMNERLAWEAALTHDVGRMDTSTAFKGGAAHGLTGFRFAMERGRPDLARFCLMHSFPDNKNICEFILDGLCQKDRRFVTKYVQSLDYDDYDKLVLLADNVAVKEGFVTIEQRQFDLAMRYGRPDFWPIHFKAIRDIKNYFDSKCGCSIYRLLPEFIPSSIKFLSVRNFNTQQLNQICSLIHGNGRTL